ncbi:hypothetical protein BX666DRAFT_2030630 [Dichotomocladium elegans]|nr:hypothetical protein BX666DRAFT_2030630 [Dichotomocladium elegans]
MFKHRKKPLGESLNEGTHEDVFGTFSKPTDTYKPLDEISLTRDFRASLILNQFADARYSSSRLTNSTTSVAQNLKQPLTTPPLSPSSSTSELFSLPSSSNSSNNNSEHGPPSTWRPKFRPTIKGDDFQDIASGPPIIPVSKSPPPSSAANISCNPYHNKSKKSIFDSDDETNPVDLFFKDFSANRRRSRRISNKISQPLSTTKKQSRFDLAAFANHLHENRLSMMQVRESKYVRLTEDEERELIQLLEKRKSMAVPLPTNEDDCVSTEDDPIIPAIPEDNMNNHHLQQPDRHLNKNPSILLRKVREEDAKEAERKRTVRKSLSMDAIHHIAAMGDDVFKSSLTMDPVKESASTDELCNRNSGVAPSNSSPLLHKFMPEKSGQQPSQLQTSTSATASKPQSSPRSSKGIGLFGSLRQASRNRPFRGLVRNLSNAGAYKMRHSNSGSSSLQDVGMSRAAMAVMQHDKDVHDNVDETIGPKDTTPTHHDGGLLTHILAKAGRAKRTKTTNMMLDNQRKGKTKSRVIRRTIIYVPPDSINFMKTLERQQYNSIRQPSAGLELFPPALPQDMVDKVKQFDKKPSSARNKKSIEQQQHGTDNILNYYGDEILYDYYQDGDTSKPEIQGLELREMDDGTVEWGIVKKQGNRKSFYMQGDGAVEHDSVDEVDKKIEEHLYALMRIEKPEQQYRQQTTRAITPAPVSPLPPSSPTALSPPPVPRRSPRRRIDSGEDHRRAKHISTVHSSKDASTTDIYFAPQQTLPSLLQMIADSAARDQLETEKSSQQPSVEEQLDEMMKSLQDAE